MEWLFSHPDEELEDAQVSLLPQPVPFGGSSTLPARYRLKAFVSHKGPSVHSGHYVAHMRFEDSWLFFNDEKVVRADAKGVEHLKTQAYLYLYERV